MEEIEEPSRRTRRRINYKQQLSSESEDIEEEESEDFEDKEVSEEEDESVEDDDDESSIEVINTSKKRVVVKQTVQKMA